MRNYTWTSWHDIGKGEIKSSDEINAELEEIENFMATYNKVGYHEGTSIPRFDYDWTNYNSIELIADLQAKVNRAWEMQSKQGKSRKCNYATLSLDLFNRASLLDDPDYVYCV